jgi:hypothetical protein
MLQCECPLLAHRDTQRCCDFTSALEAEPEMSGHVGSAASVENAHSGNERLAFAAMHGPDLAILVKGCERGGG